MLVSAGAWGLFAIIIQFNEVLQLQIAIAIWLFDEAENAVGGWLQFLLIYYLFHLLLQDDAQIFLYNITDTCVI